MSEMDTELQPGEMPTDQPPMGETPAAQPGTANPELEAIKAALKKANNEAAKYRKVFTSTVFETEHPVVRGRPVSGEALAGGVGDL